MVRWPWAATGAAFDFFAFGRGALIVPQQCAADDTVVIVEEHRSVGVEHEAVLFQVGIFEDDDGATVIAGGGEIALLFEHQTFANDSKSVIRGERQRGFVILERRVEISEISIGVAARHVDQRRLVGILRQSHCGVIIS